MRYTIKQLKELKDYELLRMIVLERRDRCTNTESPLYKKLTELASKLEDRRLEQ